LAVVIQSMAREPASTSRSRQPSSRPPHHGRQGDFEAYVLAWSGRPDPDGNLFISMAAAAAQLRRPLRRADRCVLAQSRASRDPAERRKVFEQIAARVLKERPVIYLYHRNWLWAYNAKLSGVRSVPDGLLRVTGLKMAPAP
jgi:peptide/nickel transport system substrate-binding protein